jgi:hypothetical protein
MGSALVTAEDSKSMSKHPSSAGAALPSTSQWRAVGLQGDLLAALHGLDNGTRALRAPRRVQVERVADDPCLSILQTRCRPSDRHTARVMGHERDLEARPEAFVPPARGARQVAECTMRGQEDLPHQA